MWVLSFSASRAKLSALAVSAGSEQTSSLLFHSERLLRPKDMPNGSEKLPAVAEIESSKVLALLLFESILLQIEKSPFQLAAL